MKVIAHRGNDGIHRENSMEAILNSLSKDGIDGVEMDVRMTKDGKLILNHDPFYLGRLIKETKLNKLLKLGLNSLDEVLNRISGNKIIMLDIKVDDVDKMIRVLGKLLNKYNLNFYICSFNYDFVRRFKYDKVGIIISRILNVKHIDEFDFNSINYLYKGRVFKKETFWWTVNDKNNFKGENIITDIT